MWRDIVKIVFDPNGDCDVRFVLKYVAKSYGDNGRFKI